MELEERILETHEFRERLPSIFKNIRKEEESF